VSTSDITHDARDCPLRIDAVEKVGVTLTTRNNRIAQAGFLNRSCAFDARLESILLEDPLKIFFRQYRSLAAKPLSEQVRCYSESGRDRDVPLGPEAVIK